MRHGSLFSGIGGFDLAADWMGWENVFQVEWDEWCQKILAKNFPDTLRFGDIKEFNEKLRNGEIITNTASNGFCRKGRIQGFGENKKEGRETSINVKPGIENYGQPTNIGRFDIITGGFPCQPFSHAGKRKGTDDSRYLWPEMLESIRILKPSFVVGENVAGLVSMENGKTLDRILSDLANEGYTTEQFIIPACALGAWHRRDRIWIIGFRDVPYSCSIRRNGGDGCGNLQEKRTWGDKTEWCKNGEQFEMGQKDNRRIRGYWQNWSSEPPVGGGFDGLPLWLYRHTIKGYGQEESYRRIEILRELWKTIPTQLLWQVVGGFNQIQKSEILFSLVCEYEKNPNQTRILLEGTETLERFVRGLWMQGEITGSSHRPEKGEQLSGEYSDSLQTLSRLLAHNLQENWQISNWEDGIPRVATGIKNRADRLKGLGNAIVPQIAFELFKAIEQYNNTHL